MNKKILTGVLVFILTVAEVCPVFAGNQSTDVPENLQEEYDWDAKILKEEIEKIEQEKRKKDQRVEESPVWSQPEEAEQLEVAAADEDVLVWDGAIATSFAGGSGTESDPYQISNIAELAYYAQSGSEYNAYYAITEDIYINSGTSHQNQWRGYAKYAHGKCLDGNNHTIFGLYNSSLFRNATQIKNLTIKNAYYDTADNGIGFFAHGTGIISNCHIYGEVNIETTSLKAISCLGGQYQGNYVGMKAENCSNHMNVFVGEYTGAQNDHVQISGIISYGTVTGCKNYGNITVDGARAVVAGITCVGDFISDCENYGNISVSAESDGGILYGIGAARYRLEKCYNYGKLSDASYIYGIGDCGGWEYKGSDVECTEGGIINCVNFGVCTGSKKTVHMYGIGFTNTPQYNEEYPIVIRGCRNNAQLKCEDGDNTIIMGIGGEIGETPNYIDCENNGELYGHSVYGIAEDYWVEYDGIYTIKNCHNRAVITSNGGNACGLFECIRLSGEEITIANITISECSNEGNIVCTDMLCSGIVGFIYSSDGSGMAVQIVDCRNDGDITNKGSSVCGVFDAWLQGKSTKITVENCVNAGDLEGEWVAGIGSAHKDDECNESDQVWIKNCVNEGILYGSEGAYGLIDWLTNGIMTNCCNKGDVGGNRNADGLVGWAENSEIAYCYNTGNIACHNSENYLYVAGLIGSTSGCTVHDCYNSGSIVAESTKGGGAGAIIESFSLGENNDLYSTVYNVYNCGKIKASDDLNPEKKGLMIGGRISYLGGSGMYNTSDYQSDSEKNVTYLTDAQMQQQSSFAGFDFDNVWEMGTGVYQYPVLKNSPSGYASDTYYSWDKETGKLSGTWGDMTWYEQNGTLYIVGSGEMKDAKYKSLPPWTRDVALGVTSIVLDENITKIGAYNFYKMSDVTEIHTGKIDAIGDFAFGSSTKLTEFYYGGTEEDKMASESKWGEEVETELRNIIFHYSDGQVSQNLNFEGSFHYLGFNNASASYMYNYDMSDFFKSSYSSYNKNLAQISIRVAMAAFGEGDGTDYSNIEEMMSNMKFSRKKGSFNYPKPEYNSIGYAIEHKRIYSSVGDRATVVLVAIRGAGYKDEWGGNFNVGDGVHHKGFYQAMNTVKDALEEYITRLEEDGDIDNRKELKIWITGYSRAAATSNLLASYLDDGEITGIKPDNVFAYCFECPQNTTDSTRNNKKYQNIINVINPKDFVPRVAMNNEDDWKYGRYGYDYLIPDIVYTYNNPYYDLKKEMKGEYEKILRKNDEYKTDDEQSNRFFKDNVQIAVADNTDFEKYQAIMYNKISWQLSNLIGHEEYVENWQDTVMKVAATVMNDGNEWGDLTLESEKIIRGLGIVVTHWEDVVSLASTLKQSASKIGISHYPELCLAWVDSASEDIMRQNKSCKTIYINCPVNINVYDDANTLVGQITDDKVRDIEEGIAVYVDENGQKIVALPGSGEYKIDFIPTDEGEMTVTMAQYVQAQTMPNQVESYYDIPLEIGTSYMGSIDQENGLKISDAAGESINPTVSQNGVDVTKLSVSVTAEGGGSVVGSNVFLIGEFAKIQAIPNEGEQFLGWYEDDVLISEEQEYRFRVTKNHDIQGKFTANAESVKTTPGEENGGNADDSNAGASPAAEYKYQINTDGTITITSCTTKEANLVIPSEIDGYTVTKIGDSAFADQTKIETVAFPSKLTGIGVKAFAGCANLTQVTLPDTINGLGNYAFMNCTSLKSAVLNNGRINISQGLFSGCRSLTSVTIPNTVQYIRAYAFQNCTSLKTLSLPASLATVEQSAFLYAKLTNVTYGGTKAKWETITISSSGNGGFLDATVKAADGSTFSADRSKWPVAKPKKGTIKKIKNVKKKSLKVTWKKVSKAYGYQVQIATNKKFTKNKKTKTVYWTSVTFQKLKKKTYYVRVRAYVYNNNGKKVYGAWSSVKKVKIKK